MKRKSVLLSFTLLAGILFFPLNIALAQSMMSGQMMGNEQSENMMGKGTSQMLNKEGMMQGENTMHQANMMNQENMMHQANMMNQEKMMGQGKDMMKAAAGENDQLSGQVIDGVRVINVEAFRYGYSPDPIVVKAGEKVKLNLTTKDVEHGFGIKDLDIDAKIKPGQTTVVEFTPKTPGQHLIRCTVYCGPGHSTMVATLKVLL